MTDRIEPGCMAVTVNVPPSQVPSGALVRVVDRAHPVAVRHDILTTAAHCINCAHWAVLYLRAFGSGDHWKVDFEDTPPGSGLPAHGTLPERMLRRLPPPDLASLTERKRDEVPA